MNRAVDTSHSILRSARSFLAGTALSRVSGLFRDIAMAISFGSSPEVAAFMVSYRLANLFRRLLGEGNLQAGFIPHFTALKENGGQFYRDTTYSMGLILIFTVLALEGICLGLMPVVGSDWAQIIELSMWMIPGLFFICLYGLNSSLLQCQKKFFLPAVAPVLFNFIWIGAVFYRPDVRFLSIAITAAFAGQWLVTVFEKRKILPLKQWLRPHFFSPEFKKLLRPLMLGIVGVSAVQFNSALDAIFARLADLQGPAFLWYAIRIQQLPLALFGIALSGALLPPLSRTEDPDHRKELLSHALKTSGALMLICTFGIFALGSVGVNLLYGHGDFSQLAVIQTTDCLWGYGLGLIPSVFVLILANRFYAEKNYKTPMRGSLIAVGANIAFNAFFVFGLGWGAISIAIATSLSAVLNAVILGKGSFSIDFWRFFLKMGFACALPAASAMAIESMWMEVLPRSVVIQTVQFCFLSALYLGGVAFMVWRLRLTEVAELIFRKKTTQSA
ncbi:MAG: murein biosynthesis integral membrane protein MurJ [Chlamydiae bacterium CG10_big_fil_rev_8_21_14_0_10_42_34]|nr:MAG: murein biosynthesis integral membrane protein MurJ [Chlamydiae bacterium CG10_big_fil_rev_8_21_14_0_10_42_34]